MQFNVHGCAGLNTEWLATLLITCATTGLLSKRFFVELPSHLLMCCGGVDSDDDGDSDDDTSGVLSAIRMRFAIATATA